MEVDKSSEDPEIGFTVAPSSQVQVYGLDLFKLEQPLMYFSALSQHEN